MALRPSKKRAAKLQAAHDAQVGRLRAQLAGARAELERERLRRAQMSGQATFLMGDIDGTWEVPVRFSATPGGWPAVTTVADSQQLPGLALGSVFALASAYPDQARLEDLGRSGWAIAQAWPLNAPDLLAQLPSFHTRNYMIVTLTSRALREVAVQTSQTAAKAAAENLIPALAAPARPAVPAAAVEPEPAAGASADESAQTLSGQDDNPEADSQRLRVTEKRGVTDNTPPASAGRSNFEILA